MRQLISALLIMDEFTLHQARGARSIVPIGCRESQAEARGAGAHGDGERVVG